MKNIISYGGGTQSTAMILMALEGKFNLIRPDFGVYCDTGGEPEFINNYVNYFIDFVKSKYDFTIFKIQHKTGLVDHLLNSGIRYNNEGLSYTSSIPPFYTLSPDGSIGMLNRQCTSDYKTHPINKFIRSKLKRGEIYTKWIGISFDERTRMKIGTKKIKLYYPLVENFIVRKQSIDYVVSMGLRPPQRSSCFFCPFHSDQYWLWLKKYHPTEFYKACHLELAIQKRQSDFSTSKYFLHRSCKNLSTINFKNESQFNLFPELIDECAGECGI
jgi:hypothetical protein